MPSDVIMARFASDATSDAIDERSVQIDALPAAGSVWWDGEPYRVRSVSDGSPPRMELVLDSERLLRFAARVPPGFVLSVRRPAELAQWDAVVLNVEGGVAGYARDPGDGDAAAEAALADAGI